MQLAGKHIIVGITGGIAAYKSASLVRLLVKNGAQVKVVMTPLAKEFITPVTLATLSQNTVLCDFFRHDDGAWNSHVELGLWADLFLIAPCTGNTMAKMAHGIADNLLLTTYLSSRCPIMLAPAMDLDMYAHPATVHNMSLLRERGHLFVEPGSGFLASGLIGKGRMAEPEEIYEQVCSFFAPQQLLAGKTILVTAGPTYEAIDPVRFIGNHSTGKMGFALARAAAQAGAKVELVAGPSTQTAEHPNITRTNVVSANEMYEACARIFPSTQGAIMCAAVADYRPAQVVGQKIKGKDQGFTIELIPTVDIARELGAIKRKDQVFAGFALETHNEREHAAQKAARKNFDFIVLNSLNDPGAGFGHDTNKACIISAGGECTEFPLMPKSELATHIISHFAHAYL